MAQTQDHGNRTQSGQAPQGTQPPSNQMVRHTDERPVRGSRSMGMSPYYGRSPFGFARRMFEDMERMMEQMMPGFDLPGFDMPQLANATFMPQIEISRRGDQLIVHADLPGLSPQDLQISVSDEGLVVAGERHQEQEHSDGDTWRSERSYGRFERVIPLPEGAQLDTAQARYENGVLEISVKAPEGPSKRRQIQIQSGHSAQIPQATQSAAATKNQAKS
ncbi:MAG: Hsp20/alpha crystallin family protein [Kofleriaceae bacterium]